MDNKYLLPIIDDNLKIIGTVEFKDNLTLCNVPDYVNMNCRMGLKRLDESYEKLAGEIVLMFYDIYFPKASYAEIINEREAYKYCLNRGRLDVAGELNLKFVEEVEVL